VVQVSQGAIVVIVSRPSGHYGEMGDASVAIDNSMDLPGPPAHAASAAEDPRRRLRGLVQDHFDFVWRLLRRFGVAECDADDAAQRVFWVASGKLESIHVGAERSFLYGTSRRVAWSVLRDRNRRCEIEGLAAAQLAENGPLPDEEVERRRRVAMLDEILAELPEDLKAVFVLCELEGLTAPEVAKLESIPVGTVASRLRRARQELEERIRRLTRTGSEGSAR
jgi:RNA polymerase sigma-70 factor, ECF subfamily